MTRQARKFVCAAAMVLLTAGPARAQDWRGTGRISGKVVDESGTAVKDAVVKLRLGDTGQGTDTKTDGRGQFSVLGLKGGVWYIDVEAAGYSPGRVQTKLTEDGRVAGLDIKLQKNRAQAQAKELQSALAKGDELFKAGNYAAARAEYEKVAAARPDLVEVHRSIAYTYGREKNHAEALKHLDIVLATDPSNVELLQLSVASALELNDMPRVEKYVGALDVTKLKDPNVLINVAISMLNKQQPAAAVPVLDKAVAQFPQAADPYYFRALAHLQMQRMDAAAADLEKFVSLAPPDSRELEKAKVLLSQLKGR